MEYYKGYRMKNLKCLMTDIPKINREFKNIVDSVTDESDPWNEGWTKKTTQQTILASMFHAEFEHFCCDVEIEGV